MILRMNVVTSVKGSGLELKSLLIKPVTFARPAKALEITIASPREGLDSSPNYIFFSSIFSGGAFL